MISRNPVAAIRVVIATGALGVVGACRPMELDVLKGPALEAGGTGADADGTAPPDAPSGRDADSTTLSDAALSDAATGGDDADGTTLSDSAIGADADDAALSDVHTDTPLDGANESSSTTACTAGGAAVVGWTFDTNADVTKWMLAFDPGAQVTMSWSGLMGNPSPGALEVNLAAVAPDAGGLHVWVHGNVVPAANLTGRTVSALVWLESGPSPEFYSFVQTTVGGYSWGDNGKVELTPGVWNCVTIPVSSPATRLLGYDPAQVIRIGYMMVATTPFRLLIDSVRAQ
jgi:hypothetical protein